MVKVVVIGGGVNGFGCACQIIEKFPHFKVTVIAKSFTPGTTGDGAAGLWMPYLSLETPPHKLREWGSETYKYFHSLWLQGVGGVCLIPAMTMSEHKEPFTMPPWSDVPFSASLLSQSQIQFWSKLHSLDYTGGMSFMTFTCEPTVLLPYLMKKFKRSGGEIVEQEVTSLEQIARLDFDVIINCSGIGARDIVPDNKVHAIRGQVSRVKAPWLYRIILTAGSNYIIPNIDSVVLGGTRQKDDYNTKVDPKDSKSIHEGCEKMIPGLKNAPLISEWVGLRPGRDSVRLEREDIVLDGISDSNRRKVVVIHNYGHGGSGITLFWGCSKEVIELLQNALKESPIGSTVLKQSNL